MRETAKHAGFDGVTYPSNFNCLFACCTMSTLEDTIRRAIVRAEDRAEDNNEIESLQISGSNKTSPAITHFNAFLEDHCNKKGYNNRDGIDPITTIEQLPYEGIFLEEEEDESRDGQRWWSGLIKSFLYYLAHRAKDQRYKEKQVPIGFEAATGYASAIKSYLTKRQFWGKRFVVFETEWTDIRAELLKQLECKARIAGRRITNPKLASNADDRKQMANVCFLLGSTDFAEFHAINVLMYHVIGRGREVSVLKPEDLYLVDISTRTSEQVLAILLQPDKGNEFQELNLYPQNVDLQEDVYFALCYHLLVGARTLPYLFPKFSQAATLVNANNKTESRIASVWSQFFRHIKADGQRLVDDSCIKANLTSYHARKGANQHLAETPSAGGLSQIFRAGWSVMSGATTLLKYVVSSKALTNVSGKALAGWPDVNKDVFPPALASIKFHGDKVTPFVAALFSWDTDNQWPISIRNLLVASLLRHYDNFILIIKQHPEGIYEPSSRHALVHAVEAAMSRANVTEDIFSQWCMELRERFAVDNFSSVPIHLLPTGVANNVKVDPRSLYDCFNNLSQAYNCSIERNNWLEAEVLRLRVNSAAQAHELKQVHEELQTLADQQQKILKVLEIKYDKPSQDARAPPVAVNASLFSDIVKRWSNDQSLEDYFYNYFKDQCYEGYQLELNTQDFQKKLPTEKNKISGRYKRIKRGIKVLLYFCAEYPKPPLQDPNELPGWHKSLKRTAQQAIAGLTDALPCPLPKRLTLAFLMKAAIVKDWNNEYSPLAKHLPMDTPDHIRTHFLG